VAAVEPNGAPGAVESRWDGTTGPGVVAAIDVGTNSIHMVVARRSATGGFEVLTRHKEVVRLGSGGGDMSELAEDAMDRGVAALGRCRAIAEQHGARLVAVATSAVREATNRDVFLHRARQEAGVEVDVVSGAEEARLIHLGVLQALPVWDRTILLCDIGGGSTELLVGRGEDVLASRSFKVGAIRLSRRFFPDGVGSGDSVERCRRAVRDVVAPFTSQARSTRFDVVVGSSGTIEALVGMACARAGRRPRSLNAQVVAWEDVHAVVAEVAACGSVDEIRDLPGVDASRADILLGGSLILDEVLDAAGRPDLVFSDGALREGVLLDAARRADGTGGHHLKDLRRRSVLHVMELCEDDPDHAVHIARLADRLFDGLAPLLGLAEEHRELLEAAALLCNVGLSISHSRHHQHSYYVIRNSDHLLGFTDGEAELIAQVARYHRKAAPSERHEPFARLDDDDRRTVRGLSAMLRVAVGLDRSHRGAVDEVRVEVQPDRIGICVGPPQADLSLELYSAAERRGLLEEVTGREVVVQQLG